MNIEIPEELEDFVPIKMDSQYSSADFKLFDNLKTPCFEK